MQAMKTSPTIKRIAFLGDHLPRHCGIATYTSDICEAVAAQYPQCQCVVGAVNDRPEGYDYPTQVRFEIDEKELDSFRRAADFLNINDVQVVSAQHEFGIYGGPAGSHLLAFLRDVHMPVVTTLHTLLRDPSPDQRAVMKQLDTLSNRFIVMAHRGKDFLKEIYGIASEKIDVIPHGIPDIPFIDPNFNKDQFGVEGKTVLLTFGLLSPNKGIEYVIAALPEILAQHPNVVYIVLGATHPNLLAREGESYRLKLERLAEDRGVTRNVIFYNRFVEIGELKELIGVADIFITPYLNESQITSGTLAYSFGAGKSSHFHPLLACAGVAGERSRHPGAVRQCGSNSGGSDPLSFRSGPHDGNAQTSMETWTWNDLVGCSPAAYGKLRTRASQLECVSTKSIRRSNAGQPPLSATTTEAGPPCFG
jgi:glycosyltransferase involved in cell wall biosynthesis